MSMSPHPAAEPAEDRVDEAPAPTSTSRRRFVRTVGLGAAALGAAAATGSALSGVASAQTASSEVPELTESDIELVQFLQSVCLAGEAILTSAVTSQQITDSAISEQLRTFAGHHGDQAAKFGELLTEEEQITDPNPTLTSSETSAVEAALDQSVLLGQLLDLEERMAATMLASLGEATSFLVAGDIAAVLPVVGQQAAALGQDLDAPIDSWLPAFATTDGAMTPAEFPIS
jgi:hypothetical protein